VITTRDRPTLVQRAIRSALAQSMANVEIVIVDDGTNAAVSVPHDVRVRLLRFERSSGVCAARNHGLRSARGRWIAFLDDDDELRPEMVEISRRAASNSRRPSPVSVLSTIEVTDHGGRLLYLQPPVSLDRGESYFHAGNQRSLQPANTLFAPVDVLRAIGGWGEGFLGWESDDLLLRLSRSSSIEGISQVTYRMYQHGAPRLSRDAWAMIAGGERTLHEHRRAFADSPKHRATYLARLGTLYMEVGEWRRGVSTLTASLLLDPLVPRALTRWLVSLAGPGAYRFLRWGARRARSVLRRSA
jgi:glycosyltransferase involved in cell wall biosynthesis